MIKKLQTLGNSQGIILPGNLLKALKINKQTELIISLENGRIIIDKLEEKIKK